MKKQRILFILASIVILLAGLNSTAVFLQDKTSLRVAKLFIMLILISLMVWRFWEKKWQTNLAEIFFLGFTFFSSLAVILNYKSFANLLLMGDLVAAVFFAFLGTSSFLQLNKDRKNYQYLIILVLAIGLVFSGFSYFQIIEHLLSNRYCHIFEIVGLSDNPNALSFVLCPIFLLSFSLFVQSIEKKKKRNVALFLFLSLLFFVNMLFLQSRSVLVAIFVYLLGMLYLYRKEIKSNFTLKKGIWGFVFLSFLTFLVFYFGLLENIIIKTKNTGSSYRLEMWLAFLKYEFSSECSWKHFLLGHGFEVKNWSYNVLMPYFHLHNFILDCLGRYGLLACFCLCASLLELLRINFKNKQERYLLFIPVAILVQNLFEIDLFANVYPLETFIFAALVFYPYLKNAKKIGCKKK